MKKYVPKDSSKSPRYCGNRTFMRLSEVETLEDVDIAVVGVPFDTATSFRTGQRLGPNAIREASLLLRPYNHEVGINIFEYCSAIDHGDVVCLPGEIHMTYANIKERLIPIVERGIVPICLGGDHSISLGELRAFKEVMGPVAMIHFDSHTDTWDTSMGGLKYTHGNPFRRAIEEGCLLTDHSIQIGIRGPGMASDDIRVSENLGLEVMTSGELHRIGIEAAAERIRNRVKDAPVFVTFDIDFLDPAYAPGTGTPEIGGFSTWDGQELLRKGLRGLNLVGFDLVEVLPSYDPGEITAFAGSGMIYEFMSMVAWNKRQQLEADK